MPPSAQLPRARVGALLLERWRSTGTGATPIDRRPEGADVLPLSLPQEGVWLLEQLQPGTALNTVHFAAWVRGSLDEKALRKSLCDLAERHETLRTAFRVDAAGPRQTIEQEARVDLRVEAVAGGGPAGRRRRARRSRRGESRGHRLPAGLSGRVRALAREMRTSLFMTLAAAFAALLHRWSGQDAVAMGSPTANRERPETRDLI